MKHVKTTLMVAALIIIFAVNAFSQIVVIGQSSEWEATGFNNGRRVVRDCSMPATGFNHYVWHSQNNPMNAPNGSNCDVFYACTDDFGAFIIPPTNLTQFLGFLDNRYPSIAIENDGIDPFGNWRTFNNIHLVWQCKQFAGANYEVMHGIIPVGNPPAPPAMLINILNLSNTPTNSLVPAVDINHYNP
ncbi:MAG: hypothetical protein MUF15_14340, partial [Acidobacteria bacterium]|nr:hypothetical protein [Acidobacteriota bacterium]